MLATAPKQQEKSQQKSHDYRSRDVTCHQTLQLTYRKLRKQDPTIRICYSISAYLCSL